MSGSTPQGDDGRAASLAATQRFLESLPYARALSMRVDALGEGQVTISMPYDTRLVGDPRTGVIHGGAVSALMDTSGGVAVMSLPQARGTATIDLRIAYMRPASPGNRIAARAECYHVTRSVVFVRAFASDGDESHPVAMATGAFTLERAAP